MITLKLETKNFNKHLKNFIKRSSLRTDLVIKKTAADLLFHIIRPEPYGTHPVDTGRARAGWYMSMKNLGVTDDLNSRLKSNSEVSKGKREGSFKNKLKNSNNKYVELINGVKHIVFLEYGHSNQAPAGMVRISMRKMRGKMPESLSDGFLKEWNKFRF